MCLRKKKQGEKIFIVKSSVVDHLAAGSSDKIFFEEIEFSRNWHWMWSKFYFNKKHDGILYALKAIFLNLLSAILKFIFYTLVFNKFKKKIYFLRISGLINSILNKKSWYRPKI